MTFGEWLDGAGRILEGTDCGCNFVLACSPVAAPRMGRDGRGSGPWMCYGCYLVFAGLGSVDTRILSRHERENSRSQIGPTSDIDNDPCFHSKKRKRKGPSEWTANKRKKKKRLREIGLNYISQNGTGQPAKELGMSCNCKSKTTACSGLTEEEGKKYSTTSGN
ncbi:hypothetical protein PoB_004350400 [Plakobranchus ocellatus]|uniref:Uncharacterized protein n=1 Tax=Plakobranchus ocellatus TaxID=259542 RepID=A0AAV4BA34_9GAST|nr:hypothetical protein PoB_004350400 [Plakobranchus ocellatus]